MTEINEWLARVQFKYYWNEGMAKLLCWIYLKGLQSCLNKLNEFVLNGDWLWMIKRQRPWYFPNQNGHRRMLQLNV